jgi:hypothetical protein
MELIAAVLVAGPLGYLVRGRRRALIAYLGVWVVVFPIQTVVVFSENGDDNSVLYWVFNALILTVGICLNTLGAHLRARTRASA